jgi:hypothetical protein
MKIFGLDFGQPKPLPAPLVTLNTGMGLTDASPVIRPELSSVAIPENKKPANIAPIKPAVLNYAAVDSRRGQFKDCDYDLALINRIEDTDSYVHQAFVKKVGLMFKEGYEFVGPDPKTIQYIKLRLAQMARATNQPIDELLRSLGGSLIKKSNAFLVKARKTSASGGRVRTLPGTDREVEPIAGYFLVPAEMMHYEANERGVITRWKQELPDGRFLYFKPQDVVHLYFNKKEGMIFGTPTIVPVVDDIRSLRKIEENIELLVYQHLFPLFHYKVGTDEFPAGIDERGDDEISVARAEIRQMPSEGGLVTSHRHEIALIGAENRSLRAEGYLEHFKKRVFSGLGISAVDMGEGECYSADTQTLTENGWKYHWQIDEKKERIATFNPSTHKIEFHFANYKYEGKYEGKMVHFSNGEELDILVTPHHDMWAMNFKEASKWDKSHAIEMVQSEKLRAVLLLSTAFSEDYVPDVFPTDLIEDWCKVAGYVTACGHLEGDKIVIKSRKFPKGQHPLVSSFKNLEIGFSANKINSNPRILEISFDANVFGGGFCKYLQSNGYDAVNEVLQLPIAARKILADAMLEAGGRSKGIKYVKNVGKVPHRWFIHEDQQVLDNVQTILLSCGYNATIKSTTWNKHTIKYVNVRCAIKRAHTVGIKHEHLSVVNYSGAIYCYNVPNHLFLTRRNGKVAINGNTANRATSDNMSRNLVDSVKDIQRVIESQFTEFCINELLQESTFGSDVLNEEHKVHLKFKEIDLDYQIKKETHLADQFAKNVISQHEARMGSGRQPMRIPTAEEMDNNPDIAEQFPEWYGTFWKLIEEPKALIQAIDEPYSAAAVAAAENKNTSITPGTMEEAGTKQMEHEVALEKEKGKAKVAIAKMRPKPAAKKKDSFLTTRYEALEHDTVRMLSQETYSPDWFKQYTFMVESEMIRELNSKVMTAFSAGYRSVNPSGTKQVDATMRSRGKLEQRVNFYIGRLIRHTVGAVKRQNIDGLEKDVKIQKVKAAFEALKFRNDFIEDVEIRKAFNLGVLEAASDLGKTQWTLDIPSDACEGCKAFADRTRPINGLDLEEIPPLHASSRSKIRIL